MASPTECLLLSWPLCGHKRVCQAGSSCHLSGPCAQRHTQFWQHQSVRRRKNTHRPAKSILTYPTCTDQSVDGLRGRSWLFLSRLYAEPNNRQKPRRNNQTLHLFQRLLIPEPSTVAEAVGKHTAEPGFIKYILTGWRQRMEGVTEMQLSYKLNIDKHIFIFYMYTYITTPHYSMCQKRMSTFHRKNTSMSTYFSFILGAVCRTVYVSWNP